MPEPAQSLSCFAPIMNSDTRVLILGSMPGRKSLEDGQYYSHPQSHFWRLLGAVMGTPRLHNAPYPFKVKWLLAHRIGLWAGIASCERVASADATIRKAQPVDLMTALERHHACDVQAVFFDGRASQKIFMRKAFPNLPRDLRECLDYDYLPSSSPALASIPFDEKLQQWLAIRNYL